jgi:hypothetical protein
MRDKIISTLINHAAANRDKHIMNIEVYLSNPVGVGEHSDILETIQKELDEVAKYDDHVQTLIKHFK